MENKNKEIREKITKKLFTKNSFIETQIWIYSSFSAISLAFFFSLLGANDSTSEQILTDLSIYTYSISLVSNASISFIFSIFRDDGDLIHELNLSKKIDYVIRLAWISFTLSVIFTIGIFSKIAMICSVIIGILVYSAFHITMNDLKKNKQKEHELEIEKIKKGEID